MHERLEEAEGGAEGQFEMNRKRDVELTKLRKLLEDVHMESEETAHLLKKKHSEIVADFQEQLDAVTKGKSRWALKVISLWEWMREQVAEKTQRSTVQHIYCIDLG